MPDIRKRVRKTSNELSEIATILDYFDDLINKSKSQKAGNNSPIVAPKEIKMVDNLLTDVNQIRGKVRGYLLELRTAKRKFAKDTSREISHEGADVFVDIPRTTTTYGRRKFYQLKSCSATKKSGPTSVLKDAIIQVLGTNKELVSAGGELVCEVAIRSSKCYWPFDKSVYANGIPTNGAFRTAARAQVNKAVKDALTHVRSQKSKVLCKDPIGRPLTLSRHWARNFSGSGNSLKIVVRFDKGLVVNPNVKLKTAADYYIPRTDQFALNYISYTARAVAATSVYVSRRTQKRYRKFKSISINGPAFKQVKGTAVANPAPSNTKKRSRGT